MKTTDNYGLNLPEVGEFYDVRLVNENTKKIDALLKQFNEMKATLESLGLVKLSDSEAVTDSTGLALPATEKNATIEGTLANQISKLNTDISNMRQVEIATSILEWIKSHNRFPICASIVIRHYIPEDAPTNGAEYMLIAFGDGPRITVLACSYSQGAIGMNSVFIRHCFNGTWYSDWIQIYNG